MTIKKIGTGKASGGATTTKTSGVSGTTTLNTAAINTGMQALQTATPQDTISAIQRLSTTGTGIQPLTTLNAAIVDPSTQTPQTSIDAIQRVQAAAAASAARAGATTVEQEATAQGILETGAFSSLSERVGDATLQILTGFNRDEFGIENYNDPMWATVFVDSDGELVLGEAISGMLAGSTQSVISVQLGVSQVLCRLVQESDMNTYDLVGYDSYFIMDLDSSDTARNIEIAASADRGRGGGPSSVSRPSELAKTGGTPFEGFYQGMMDRDSATTKPDDSATAGTTGMLAGAFFGGTAPSTYGLRTASFSANIWTHGRLQAGVGSGPHMLIFKLCIPIAVGDYTEMSIFMIAKGSSDYTDSEDGDALRTAVFNYMASSAAPTEFCGYMINDGLYGDYDSILSYGCGDNASTATAFGDAINRILDGSATISGGSINTGGLDEEIDVGSLLKPYVSVVSTTQDFTDTTGCPGSYTQIHIVDLPLGSTYNPKLEIYVLSSPSPELQGLILADTSGAGGSASMSWYYSGNYYYHDQNTYTFI